LELALDWRRVLVVRKEIPALIGALALLCILTASALGQQVHGDEVTAEGVVVAVQLPPGAVRSAMAINAVSVADFAEVWMIRLNRPISAISAKYVLVEYIHVNHHEPFVTDRELDRTAWKFNLRPVPQDRPTCFEWGERYVPTSFGRHEKLPTPKTLACFEMSARPVPVDR
jgi:hypothetical protein